MNTITFRPEYSSFPVTATGKNIFTRFLTWIKSEEKNHIAWVGISITAMSAVFFPITMLAVLLNGASFQLIIGAMIALALVVITNLAALPTKYTIPALLLGVLVDIILIVASFLS